MRPGSTGGAGAGAAGPAVGERGCAAGGHRRARFPAPAGGGGGHGSQVSRSPLGQSQAGTRRAPAAARVPAPRFQGRESLPARCRGCWHRSLQTLPISASPEWLFFSLGRTQAPGARLPALHQHGLPPTPRGSGAGAGRGARTGTRILGGQTDTSHRCPSSPRRFVTRFVRELWKTEGSRGNPAGNGFHCQNECSDFYFIFFKLVAMRSFL